MNGHRVTMATTLGWILVCGALLAALASTAVLADEWPDGLAREGECVVCARRGAAHGAEDFAAWRSYEGGLYGFCSASCAEAFDQMPGGYVEPVLPRPAPEFLWVALDGTELAADRQTALVIDFWATWCKPCIEAMPELERIAAEYAGRGVRVVGVSIDEDPDALTKFLRRRPLDYPVVHDDGDEPAWWQFQVPAIPAAFLVDGRGEVVAQWNGELDLADLRARLDALVAED